MGQPASPAAWLQPGHGCRRQQERTDHLGRASKWRGLPRRPLKARHQVVRRWSNELYRSDRRATTLDGRAPAPAKLSGDYRLRTAYLYILLIYIIENAATGSFVAYSRSFRF